MQEKENIEQLFRDAFSNYEEPVKPELWTKISKSIQAPTPQITDPSAGVNSSIATGSGFFGSTAVWVAGAALVVLSGLGIYYISTQNSTEQSDIEKITVPEKVVDQKSIAGPSKLSEASVNSELQEQPGAVSSLNNTEKTTSESGPAAIEKITLEQPVTSTNTIENLANTQTTPQTQDLPVSQNQPHSSKPSESEVPKSAGTENTNTAVATLRANPVSGIAPLTVDFSYNGEARKTEWQFGDGHTSSQINMEQHTFEKPGTYAVTLKVYDDQGHVTILNQSIKVMENLHIKYIPNIFTPNNDGRNDIFTFETPNLSDLEVSIYDHSGKFVYKWTGLEGGWDGKLNSGDVAPEGTYFYIIFATSENQQKHQQKGTITLKR